jgi:hypothetical protein
MIARQQILAHLFNNILFRIKDEVVVEVLYCFYADSDKINKLAHICNGSLKKKSDQEHNEEKVS